MRHTCRPSGALGYLVYPVRYKHVAPLGLSAKTGKPENGIDLIRISIVGTTIVVPYNSFAVAVPLRL